jgi:hypothetical protein
MFTLVGTQKDFSKAMKELIELEYETVEAYDVAYDKLTANDYKLKLNDFKKDHKKHIEQLTELLSEHNITAPKEASIGNQWLTKGKVIISGLIGDNSILKAMLSNEIDTNVAYERMCIHDSIWKDAENILKSGLEDEKKHKVWLENTIKE